MSMIVTFCCPERRHKSHNLKLHNACGLLNYWQRCVCTSVKNPVAEITLHYMECFSFFLFQFLYLHWLSSRKFIRKGEAGMECFMTYENIATWKAKAVFVCRSWWRNVKTLAKIKQHCRHVHTVMDLISALPGGGSVNAFQRATMEAVSQ
jgi:hypothetical protein